jgi:FkbM family methyltransferase
MLINLRYLKEKYNMHVNGVLHVGAHYGEEINDYIDCGINNMALFEPLCENFKVLSQRCENLPCDIKLHNVALGSYPHATIMNVSDNEAQSSSILNPKVHLSHHPNVKFTSSEKVAVNILDNYKYYNYNLICMDVQGYELEVLKGAKTTLKYVDYVYCEVNRDELYEGNAYVEDIDYFLSQYNMKRVETDWSGGLWGDAFYIKN